MLATIIIAAFNFLLTIFGYVFLKKQNEAKTQKTKAETEEIVVKQFDLLVERQKDEIKELREEVRQLKEIQIKQKIENEECEYDHMVAKLKLAIIRKVIDLKDLPKETVFVLDDNSMVAMEFSKYFRDIWVLNFKAFTSPEDFLNAAKREKPPFVILDYILGNNLTAEDVINDLGYVPEIFIMSQDKNIRIRSKERGFEFFHKERNYVAQIAKLILEYSYHKS